MADRREAVRDPDGRPAGSGRRDREALSGVPALAGVRRAEYDPANTRTSWEDGRWGG
ncbi:hypothetical protein GCM10022232_49490 [Streptomyces plumbiresistens]|uniref:Uncharacterized protein n=1 Tax=Streptomyces plumbiresistens TaxID=511811 RepID=A0ABP7RYZ3_9ACTN